MWPSAVRKIRTADGRYFPKIIYLALLQDLYLDGVDAEAVWNNLNERCAAAGDQHLIGAQVQRQAGLAEYVRKRLDQLRRQ